MRTLGIAVLACGIAVLGCTPAGTARAEDPASVLDGAAGRVNRCISDQTIAELGKGTAPGKFESVLREKCRAQEQHFRTTLLRGLEKEGALDKKMRQTIEELLAALRHQSVVAYADMLKKLKTQPSAKQDKTVLDARALSAI
jgi:hypothetical protein